MPIDFAAVAARFSEQLAEQTHPLPFLFDRLEDAVKKLVEQSEKAERATRAYPIFRYRDGALAVHVDPLGAELLPSASAPLGFVAGLQAGGRRFLAELGWTRTAVRAGARAAADARRRRRRGRSRRRVDRPLPRGRSAAMFDDRAAAAVGRLRPARARLQQPARRRGAGAAASASRRARRACSAPRSTLGPPSAPPAARGARQERRRRHRRRRSTRSASSCSRRSSCCRSSARRSRSLVHDGALAAKRLILTELDPGRVGGARAPGRGDRRPARGDRPRPARRRLALRGPSRRPHRTSRS